MGIPFPDVPEGGAYLAEAISDLGWSFNSGFGEGPVMWSEIRAYAETTGTMVDPWEFRCIRRMSVNYASERNHDAMMRIAPYDRED